MSQRPARNEVVTTVLIVAVTLIAAVAIGGFVFALFGSTASVQRVEVSITPEIYSPGSNIGVLNQRANFSISIRNPLNLPQNVTLVVLDSTHPVQSIPFEVGKQRTMNGTVTQELDDVGYWTVEAKINGTGISSYSFQVVTNSQEADFQINQYRLAVQSNDLALAALVISIVSAVVAAAAYLKPRSSKWSG